MNFGELKTIIRTSVPAAKDNRISSSTLGSLINEVVKDISMQLDLLKTNVFFNVVAEQESYPLSGALAVADRIGKIDEPGLWWNNGTASSPDWKKLLPRTIKWMDENRTGWRDLSSGSPVYYIKHGQNILINPKPNTSLSNGFNLYIVQQPSIMSADFDYPFGSTEIPSFSILTKAIVKGVEAYLLPMVGEDEKQPTALSVFQSLVEELKSKININPDVDSDDEARIKLERVC